MSILRVTENNKFITCITYRVFGLLFCEVKEVLIVFRTVEANAIDQPNQVMKELIGSYSLSNSKDLYLYSDHFGYLQWRDIGMLMVC